MNPPAPQEVLDHHSRLREALEALEFKRVVSEPTSNFFGLAELRDFNAAIDETREELDQQTVMMLVASCEALFRRDCEHRATDRRLRRDAVANRLRTVKNQATGRVELGDIFTVWETETGKIQLFQGLRQLMKRRHWLAHGRYWADKSGFPPDPTQAFELISAVCAAVAQHSGDFPRHN